MRRVVFGEPVAPRDVEQLPTDSGPVEFTRICTAIISRVLGERLGRFTVPEISEPIHVPDHGIDAEFVAPEGATVIETGGIVGPGRTVFQFKFRDVTRRPRSEIVRKLSQQAGAEFARVAARCDRYILMTNIQLTGPQSRSMRDAILSGSPLAAQRFIVVWGASEVASALNQAPDLRHLFFARGGLSTIDIAERELRNAYQGIGWPEFVNRADELKALSDFVAPEGPGVLQVVGPKLAGKTRLVLEGLGRLPIASSTIWSATPEHATLDLFRDLDEGAGHQVLVVDRCDDFASSEILEWALTRRRLKTILIREGGVPRDVPGLLTRLDVGPLAEEHATALMNSISSQRFSWLQRSWLREATAGLPGLIVYFISLTSTSSSAVGRSGDFKTALEGLLYNRYLADLSEHANRALRVASLLTVLGVEGYPARESAAVCRALDCSTQGFMAALPELELRGLLQRRGRFIEVVPPVLGEYLAGRALSTPERVLSELELEFSEDVGAFRRLLERLRNVTNPGVRQALRNLFSEGGWFTDLPSLVRNAKEFEILAPAVPVEAARRLHVLLDGLSIDDLRSQISGATRRAVVWTLDRLTLRTDTFDVAARLLLILAEAENETWANNATGLASLLFHWQHPEISAPFGARLRVLKEFSASSTSGRRRLVAVAAGGAFKEHVSIALHHPAGPEMPTAPYRPETWGEVRSYASAILDILVTLAADTVQQVRDAAQDALLDSLHSFIVLALGAEEIDSLGPQAVVAVERAGREAPNATARIKILQRVQFVLDKLENRKEPTAAAMRQELQATIALLTRGDFQTRLWAAVGPPPWSHRSRPRNRPSIEEDLEQIATELVSSPPLLTAHLAWLTSSDAKGAPQLFARIGSLDRGGAIFANLVRWEPKDSQWSSLFAAYIEGWSRESPEAAEQALDAVQQDHPDALEGVMVANRILPQSERTIRRLLTSIRHSERPRVDTAQLLVGGVQWDVVNSEDMQALLRAADDGSPQVRRILLHPLALRLARGVALTKELEDLAWKFLEASTPVMDESRWFTWDETAHHLAEREPERVLELLERIFKDNRQAGREIRLEHELPLTWAFLLEKHRTHFLRFLLTLALETDDAHLEFALGEILDPRLDALVIRDVLQRQGATAAQFVAEILDPSKVGYVELIPEVIAAGGGDSRTESRLHGRLFSGGWTGSAVPMIRERIDSVRQLTQHPNARVAQWAREALVDLEAWERRETREDQEEWMWDYRVRRSQLEAMVNSESESERLWAITRLLQHAPRERVLELLTPHDIELALTKGDLDERTHRIWEAYVKHWKAK